VRTRKGRGIIEYCSSAGGRNKLCRNSLSTHVPEALIAGEEMAVGVELAVQRAQALPSLVRRVVGSNVLGIFSEHNSQAGLQVPVNMAVEEPRSGIVSDKAEGHVVSLCADAHGVPTNRVCIVVCVASRDSDNVKVVTVKMERVIAAPGNVNLVNFVRNQAIDRASRQEAASGRGAA